jgi:hypothetical protein
MKTPTTFYEWCDTEPKEFLERMEAGETGNRENPWIAARYAFEAGVRAGEEIAARRLTEVILNRKIDWSAQ